MSSWVDDLNSKNAARANKSGDASIKRLKQRIARVSWRFESLNAAGIRREVGQCIDEWHEAEEMRRRRKG